MEFIDKKESEHVIQSLPVADLHHLNDKAYPFDVNAIREVTNAYYHSVKNPNAPDEKKNMLVVAAAFVVGMATTIYAANACLEIFVPDFRNSIANLFNVGV